MPGKGCNLHAQLSKLEDLLSAKSVGVQSWLVQLTWRYRLAKIRPMTSRPSSVVLTIVNSIKYHQKKKAKMERYTVNDPGLFFHNQQTNRDGRPISSSGNQISCATCF